MDKKSRRRRAALNQDLETKLLQAKSVLQCVALAFESPEFHVDEPSWALLAGLGLIQMARDYPEIESIGDACEPMMDANAITETVLAAHDTQRMHCRKLEFSIALRTAVTALDRTLNVLRRLPTKPKARAKKPRLHVVRDALENTDRPHTVPTQQERAS